MLETKVTNDSTSLVGLALFVFAIVVVGTNVKGHLEDNDTTTAKGKA